MKLYTLIPLLVAAGKVFGQAGANYTALGKNLANPASAFALANNPATGNAARFEAAVFGCNRFTGTNLNYGGVGIAGRLKATSIGLNLHYKGTELYQQNLSEIAVGQKINKHIAVGFALGINHTLQAYNFGNKSTLHGKLGAQYIINPKLDAAMVLANPWQQKNTPFSIQNQVHFGMGYQINTQTKIFVQAKNMQGENLEYGLGVQYQIKQITALAALSSGPEPVSAGIQIQYHNYRFSLASAYHIYLGFSPTFSLQWCKF